MARAGVGATGSRSHSAQVRVTGGVTYDTGALLAAERNDRQMWVRHNAILELGIRPVVPAPVLAQAWRGGGPRQANLARLLRTCRVEALTEEQAKSVGALSARSGHDDVVDVTVVEGAARRSDLIRTSDPDDLRPIAAVIAQDVTIDVV